MFTSTAFFPERVFQKVPTGVDAPALATCVAAVLALPEDALVVFPESEVEFAAAVVVAAGVALFFLKISKMLGPETLNQGFPTVPWEDAAVAPFVVTVRVTLSLACDGD
jgi:hypothetical protein